MTSDSASYELASELYDAFRGKTDFFSADERERSGVTVDAFPLPGTPPSPDTEALVAWGTHNGNEMRQQLALGKQGVFYFIMTFTERDNFFYREHISPTADDKALETLRKSLFVDAAKRIVQAREPSDR